ncbi:hypothetical protein ACU610_21555 [Geodermatophilus sp. URMC 61]|uniref:hypothetical protein n=1 Tax=Geodermatophilus sp. URMC 61 TaxID=3423411 RepID=UPI00406CBF3D
MVADRAARGAHFSPRVHDALYGSAAAGREGRWHRQVASAPGPRGVTVEAAELLDTATGVLLVVHVQLAADPVADLAALTAPAGPGREWLAALLGPDLALDAGRARAVTHLVWEGALPGLPAGLPERFPQPTGEAAHPVLDWWAWYLAAGVTPQAFVPDVDGPDWTQGRIRLSRDWSALVLRDGISFVACTPRTPAGSGPDFHASARVYARTLHVDVLLLGILQHSALHEVADSVAELDIEELDAEVLERLERDLLRFRIGLWWNDVGQRGQQTSAVLVGFQQQHRLPALYEQLVQDLTDLSRYWKAREAAEQEAVRHAEERQRAAEDRQERRVVSAITVVSFLLLPLTVVYTGAAVIAEPSWGLFAGSSAAGVVLCLLAWVWRRATAGAGGDE